MTDLAEHMPFLRSVIAAPDDDLPRLIYADWLDEVGESERAEFIRCQIELAKWELIPGESFRVEAGGKVFAFAPGGVNMAELRRRERELFAQSPETQRWFGPVIELARLGSDWWQYLRWFRRGFVESITCTAADWLAHEETILEVTPIREVHLTTWPGAEAGYAPSEVINVRAVQTTIAVLSEVWPGIKFTLPPVYQSIDDPTARMHNSFAEATDWLRERTLRAMGIPEAIFRGGTTVSAAPAETRTDSLIYTHGHRPSQPTSP